jgi:DNA mismatch repair protein MutL
MAIRSLPPLVVSQIAAGEVVERPASVVKELVENAIDAAATRIEIAIENGGRDLIRITDDGKGIPLDELTLAVAPHATSKIETVHDLESIATLGFRGEALASIASVSRLSVVSRPRDAQEAGRIDVEGDQVGQPRPAPGPPGTTVTVRNLFFNTPARRKFLRTDQTETARITAVVEALALAHHQVGFALRVDGKTALDLPPDQAPRRRILDVIGAELEPELLPFAAEQGGLIVSGLAGRPAIARGTSRGQRIFVNARPVSDPSVGHAIREAYRGLIDPARHPTIVLFLDTDPRQVDVNVHPSKSEVRFRNPSQVHGAVLSAVRGALREADLTPALDTGGLDASSMKAPFGSGLPRGASAETHEFVERFHRLDQAQKGFVFSQVRQALAAEAPEVLAQREQEREILPVARTVVDVLQVHASYLVTQDEQGLLIIDQHALHERVMFETLLEAVGKGNLESQRLLMPAMVEVDPTQMELLEALQPLLARIGIDAEPAGPAAVAVHAFSSFLFERNVEPAEFLRELLDRASREGLSNEPESALRETLDMMACKAAIKAGDRLTAGEIAELLGQRESVERSSNCPHGRPTTLRLTIRELERQFGRR